MTKFCYICGSFRFVDEHHYDCKEGRVSPEVVPLCRRCHRTYHDWGLGSFSPDTTPKALEVENYRRKIYGLPLLTEEKIDRSSYWAKKWGLPSRKKGKQHVVPPPLPLFEIDSKSENQPLRGKAGAISRRIGVHARQDTEPALQLTGPAGRG